jgi:restriction endonuclease S subunit
MRVRTVNISKLEDNSRFDGKYYNSAVNIFESILQSHSTHTLDYYCERIFTSSRGKRVYTSPEFGLPFLSNSDMISSDPFSTCNYNSKKYGVDENSLLKSGMILTGRVGAIGQIAYVPKSWEDAKAMGSDNIIRICVDKKYNDGFIYAFLASTFGRLSFWKHSTGGVQPFITDSMVGTIPIPDFSNEKKKTIDSLIKDSVQYREESIKKLNEAKQMLLDFIHIPFSNKPVFKATQKNCQDIIKSLKLRLDPPALINNSVEVFRKIRERCILLAEANVNVFRPGIFKRNYVQNGIPYIKGSEVFDINPFPGCEHLSKTRTPFVDQMLLKKNQILITCAGSVGKVKLITQEYEDKQAIGSQDIIRLESNDSLYTSGYLFTYLQIPLVFDYIQSMKYGSVIERIEPFHVESIPVIKPTKEVSMAITRLIDEYSKMIYAAFCKEEKAISMVDAEIESWKNN